MGRLLSTGGAGPPPAIEISKNFVVNFTGNLLFHQHLLDGLARRQRRGGLSGHGGRRLLLLLLLKDTCTVGHLTCRWAHLQVVSRPTFSLYVPCSFSILIFSSFSAKDRGERQSCDLENIGSDLGGDDDPPLCS